MKPFALLTTAMFLLAAAPIVGVAGLTVVAAAGAGTATAATQLLRPSPAARADIPAELLDRFIDEAGRCDGLPWTVLAAISKVDSDHDRANGAQLQPTGEMVPHLIGPALDGTDGHEPMPDTDTARWDNDPRWDHHVGPFLFLPAAWRVFGVDASGDASADPHNYFDALRAVRTQVCPEGRIANIGAALLTHRNDAAFIDHVLEWAQRYTAGPTSTGGYALPVPPSLVDEAKLTAPHHDYPAWDIALPGGTPVYAMVAGTVVSAFTDGVYDAGGNRCGSTITIAGNDGGHYIYCHLSTVAVASGQQVVAGDPIGLSGGQPGAPGAGNTTAPHLHIGIRYDGRTVCPQPLLLAIALRATIPAIAIPTAGCVLGSPPTNWRSWLTGTAT